ncbi:FG-GAP-like repeat-containing protein [uncultured Pontibacter sp.]|uniref:FG-GAP-like repeat-containing protein n=1 Tax=uncultured Pontibacter sp. TaxID=453356 RepID=UPI0026189623|nr:FG-GAP-like repeat-containing protein [uncultured Pontibacter sp.]
MRRPLLTVFLLATILHHTLAQLTPARQENSLKFDNQLLLAPVKGQLDLGSEFTMSCWVNPSSRTPYSIVMGKPAPNRGQDPYMSYVISWSNNGNRLEFVQTTGSAGSYRSVTAPADAPLNTWTHVAATLQNGTMRLFINGQEAGSTASPGTPPVNQVPFGIGGGIDGTNYCCGVNGNLMQASVWSRALSAAEILSLAETNPAPTATGLVAFWKMDEGEGQTVRDLSVNNLHLQLGIASTADAQDPSWTDNFVLNNGPFYTLHQNELPIQHALTEVFPFRRGADKHDFVGSSLQWPPLPPPGAFRPLEYLTIENNQVLIKTSETFTNSPQMVHARHSAQGDFNGDGLNDFIIIGHGTDIDPFPGEQSLIFIQQTDGILKDETSTRFPAALDFTHHVTVGDIDKDGDLDVYFANIGGGTNGPRMLLNDGTGVFTVGANLLPASVASRNQVYTSSVFADFDRDSDLDLFLGADENGGENLILFNNGQGRFDISPKSRLNKLPDNTWIGVGVAVADFDNDGDPDLVSNNTRGNPFYQGAFLQLLFNDGAGGFSDRSDLLPVAFSQSTSNQEWVVWVDAVDVNKDGWIDLVTKGNSVPGKVFLNYGGFFRDMTHLLPSGYRADNAFRAADFDGDGDMDLLAISGKSAFVLENVKQFQNSIARIATAGRTSFCTNEAISTTLTAYSATGYTHQWLKDGQAIEGATANTFTATEAGSYSVVSKNGSYPPTTSQPTPIEVTSAPTAQLTQSSGKLLASEGISYKWYLNGQLQSFNTREITPTLSGEYRVEVTYASGCIANSNTLHFSVLTGLKEFAAGKLQLYPNPTSNGEIVIAFDNQDQPSLYDATVQILSVEGKVLQEAQLRQQESRIMLPKAKGIYLVKVIKSDSAYTTKVVRN